MHLFVALFIMAVHCYLDHFRSIGMAVLSALALLDYTSAWLFTHDETSSSPGLHPCSPALPIRDRIQIVKPLAP